MAVATIGKGSQLEVSSDDGGFLGAWYVATVLDVIVKPSSTKKKSSGKKSSSTKKIEYLVKYDMLRKEDNEEEPLTEIVDSSCVRPVPPRNLRRSNDGEDNGEFEVYDVVDAFLRDGWWIGVVSKVIIDGEMKKYVVSFENPREEAEFKREELRLHVDFVGGRWKVPPRKKPEQESAGKNGTQTSESNNVAHSDFNTPLKGALTNDSDHLTVGGRLSARKKSRSGKKSQTNAELVGDVDGSVPQGKNQKIMDVMEENSHGKKFQSSTGNQGNIEVVLAMKAPKFKFLNHRSLNLEQDMIPTETNETEDNNSQRKRKRGRPHKLKVIRSDGLLHDEITTDLDQQPLSVWYQGLHPHSVSKRSACCSPPPDHHDEPRGGAVAQVTVNNSQFAELQHAWPFTKRSPIWDSIESLESLQRLPQRPHFSPLKKLREDLCEGVAIGYMVTFETVVQTTLALKVTDPKEVFENSLETLVELEAHGFDVAGVRARLTKLLSVKMKVLELEGELKEAKNVVKKQISEKNIIDKEIEELEAKIQELQEKLMEKVLMKNATENDEMKKLQSNLDQVFERIMGQKLDFEILVAQPL